MPTAELALHYAGLKAAVYSPWLLGAFRTAHVAQGYAMAGGEL